jgi:hypothetical protein
MSAVKADQWRILVGPDAHKIDELVRRSPERAYDVDFFEQFARELGWHLPTHKSDYPAKTASVVMGFASEVRFPLDSSLEEAGFELSVPPERKAFPRALDRFRQPSSLRAPWEWDVKRRLRGVEFPAALFDAASPLVPGNGGADVVRSRPLCMQR